MAVLYIILAVDFVVICFSIILIHHYNKQIKERDRANKKKMQAERQLLRVPIRLEKENTEQDKVQESQKQESQKQGSQKQESQENEQLEQERKEQHRKVEYNSMLEKKINDFKQTLEAIPKQQIQLIQVSDIKKELPKFKMYELFSKRINERVGNYTVINVQTTGLKESDRIIELSAIRFRDFEPKVAFNTLINPEIPIPPEESKINGITDDMVTDAPKLSAVEQSFTDFIQSDPIVGHNIVFGLKMLYSNGIDIFQDERKCYDTMEIAQRALKVIEQKWDKDYSLYVNDYDSDYDVLNYKLSTLCDFYDIVRDDEHRSLSDCLATGMIFDKLSE